MDVRGRAVRVLKRAGLYEPARGAVAKVRQIAGGPEPIPEPIPEPAPPQPEDFLRVDPIPELQPFPDARYVFAVGAIPRRYAGRTASILTKTKLMWELGGVKSEILTMNYSGELDDVTHELRTRGVLADGVKVINLHDFLGNASEPYAGEPVVYPIDEPGMVYAKDKDEQVYRYYENGVYRLYKRYAFDGRLIIRDWFNENRGRTRRDEFYKSGMIRKTTYHDLHYNRPRQEVYFRPNGTAYMNKWLRVLPDGYNTEVHRVTLFDEEGKVTRVMLSDLELIQQYLDRVVGEDRVFLTVESRRSDPETLTFKRDNVKQIYVLHNPHIVPPHTDPKKIRPTYRQLFGERKNVDALVFLTNAQRADAEFAFGKHDNFHVIPHSIQAPEPDPTVERDSKLVVMMARLDQQKQVEHAIDAFAKVVKQVPNARLRIYGRGELQASLQQRIDSRNLGNSVELAGYTKNPSGEYARAGLSLLTSKYEGFGLVILESLAHGCPVVSYDLKYGPADIIRDGVDGFVVPGGDVATLADRIVGVLTDPALQAELTRNAYDAVKGFSPEVFVARWSQLFNTLDRQGWGKPAEPPGDASTSGAD